MRRLLTELFVSDSAKGDPEAVQRILRTVMLGLAIAVWAPVFAPIYLLAGASWSAISIVMAGLVCLLMMFALRWGASVGVMAQALTGLLYVILFVVACLTGGIDAPSLTWLCSVPIVAVLLGGRTSGMVWMILAGGAAAFFFAVDQSGVPFPTEATSVGQQWLQVTSLCGIVACATLLTVVFRRTEHEARVQLDEARRQADEANRAKGDFLAKMSHEIRTPMNGVIGMTQLAMTTQLTAEQRDYLEAAQDSAESLLEVVNDILDFARIEAGKVELRSKAFRVRALLRRTMTLLSTRTDPEHVTVSWEVDEQVPEIVIADMGRIRQVLINLAGNAIKFTHAGEVSVHVSTVSEFIRPPDASDDCDGASEPPAADAMPASESIATSPDADPDQTLLQFVVRDTGVGIAEEQQAKIFEEFEQADGSIARMFGGTGLGLSITRGLMTLMGGRISLESEVDVGSTFTFTVPVVPGTELDLAADDSSVHGLDEAAAARLGELSILVVDDNLTNQVLIRGLLQKQGVGVTVVDSGQAAIDQVQQNDYDLVLMDVEMPGMDGFEATQRIRQQEDPQDGRVPIFALTAHTLPHYGVKCFSAGMDGFLSKPLQVPELMAIIQRVAQSHDEATSE